MFGVVITNFNCEKFIEITIKRVFSQTLKPEQVVVVDDASTDRSLEILENLQKEYNFQLIKNPRNMERVYSRNRGVEELKTPWVCFLDCDDLWEENYLASVEKYLKQNPKVEAIFTPPKGFINEEGKVIKKKKPIRESLEELLFSGRVGYPSGSCFKRETFISLGGYKDIYLHREDWEIFLRFYVAGKILGLNLQREYWIREHPLRSSTNNPQFLEATLRVIEDYLPLIPPKWKPLMLFHAAEQCYRFGKPQCGKKYLIRLLEENPKLLLKPKIFWEIFKRLPKGFFRNKKHKKGKN